MEWLDENLKMEIKKVFEPRYQKSLTHQEIADIAYNLVSYVEKRVKFVSERKNEN